MDRPDAGEPPTLGNRGVAEDPPPIFGAWWRLYAVVIGELIATIAILWWLTRAFA